MENSGKHVNRTCELLKSTEKKQLFMDAKVEKKFPTVSKKMVRNIDVKKPNVTIQKTINSVKHLEHPYGHSSRGNIKHPQYKDASSSNLTKPGLCTALQIADDIIKTVATEKNKDDYKKSNFAVVRNETGQISSVKVLKKMNIPFTVQIYKDLINLEISDEDVCARRGVLPAKTREFVKNKDQVPVLSHYYQPVFSQEYKIEKQVRQFDIEKIKYYDGHRVTDKVKTLEMNGEI